MKWLEVMAPRLEWQHGLCTWNQLLDAGVTRDQIQSAVTAHALVRVQPMVYALAGAPPSSKRNLLAACLSSGGFASHRSAAALWGVPAPGPPRPEILSASHHRPRVHNTIVHRTDRLDRVDRTTRDGIPTTALARTVLDLGGVC